MQKKPCEDKALCKSFHYPSISLIVPAYNKEKHISKCITSLFKTAAQHPNFCEIIVVDNGSSDFTYEIAWATIQRCRRRWPNIKGKVIRYGINTSWAEAIKIGVNSAFGELILILDANVWWELSIINKILEKSCDGEYCLEMRKNVKVFPNPWI
ncbi:MAG: glycosyltransferase family 2 protein [Candidatus Bathyarchaeia archaeon]